MQKNLILLALGLLLISFVSASHPADEIINNERTLVINFIEPLIIVGNNCYSKGDVPTEIEQTLTITNKGNYEIYGKILRGNPNQKQTKEALFLEINNEKGPIAEDDADPEAISERIDFLGSFNLNTGSHTMKIKTAAACPPDKTANSVEIKTLYILPPETSECTENCSEEPCIIDCDNEEPCTIKCDDGTNEDKDKKDNGKSLDCPVEYYDPFPKYYNCPIDEYKTEDLQKQILYDFSPKEISKMFLESKVISLNETIPNKDKSITSYALYISLLIILTGLSTFLLILLILTVSM